MKCYRVGRMGAIALLTGAVGCTEAPASDGVAEAQAALDPLTVIGTIASITGKIYDFAVTATNIANQFAQLESQVAQLGQEVADAVYIERRDAILGMNRDLAALRGDISSALFNIDETPSMWSGPQTVVMSAADALTSDSYYVVPGRTAGSADRFDPRASTPTFMEAVNAWLSVRGTAGLAMTDEARARLQGYADTLTSNIQRTVAATTCYRRMHTVVENDCAGSHCTRTVTCVTDILCSDLIAGTSSLTDVGERSGTCGSTSVPDATASANAAKPYGIDDMTQTVAVWRQF